MTHTAQLEVVKIARQYNGDRPNAMVIYALRIRAIEKIKHKPFEEVINFAEEEV